MGIGRLRLGSRVILGVSTELEFVQYPGGGEEVYRSDGKAMDGGS